MHRTFACDCTSEMLAMAVMAVTVAVTIIFVPISASLTKASFGFYWENGTQNYWIIGGLPNAFFHAGHTKDL